MGYVEEVLDEVHDIGSRVHIILPPQSANIQFVPRNGLGETHPLELLQYA
jgi:hypothetical protein